MGKIYSDITKTVGNTPLVRINRIAKDLNATILVKIESFNPLSSIKDRIGIAMIEDAEQKGFMDLLETNFDIVTNPKTGEQIIKVKNLPKDANFTGKNNSFFIKM